MSDKKKSDSEELDFVTKASFQKSVTKAKRKQTVKFLIIGSISTIIILYALYMGGSYLLQKRLTNNDDVRIFSEINGANVYRGSESYVYGFLSVVSHVKIEKVIGDRIMVWNSIEEEIPVFGRKNMIDNGRFTEMSGFNDRFNRHVHYNSYNGEREVEFYYPQLDYDYLPDELGIATELEKNTLAEVALSFDQAYTLEEIEGVMGEEHVNWLWVNTTTQEEIEKLSEPNQHYRPSTSMDGPSADGFQIRQGENFLSAAEYFLRNLKELSEEGKYQSAAKKMAKGITDKSFPKVNDIRITGAVVTGTPSELERFQDLGIVRASTIGATTTLY